MQVNLMINNSDNNDVNKNLTPYKMGINCNLKDSTELLTPTIRISKDNGVELDAFNYVYIPDFSRYYYVTNSSKELGGVIQIECRVDVLMSHKNDILNLTAIVSNQQRFYNLYDNSFNVPDLCYKRIQTFYFPNNLLNNDTLILVTGGA